VSAYDIKVYDKQCNNMNRGTIIDEPCSAFCTSTAQSDVGYRLEDPRFDFGTSRLYVWVHPAFILWVTGVISPGVSRPGLKAAHAAPSSAEVRNDWSYTSTPLRLHGVHRDSCTFNVLSVCLHCVESVWSFCMFMDGDSVQLALHIHCMGARVSQRHSNGWLCAADSCQSVHSFGISSSDGEPRQVTGGRI